MYKPQSLRGRPGRLQGGGAIRASAAVPSAAGGAGGPRRPRDGVQASASPALEVQEADSVAIFQRSWDVYQRALTYDSMHHQQLYSIIRQRAEQLQAPIRMLDLGCGDSDYVARIIRASPQLQAGITSYTGVDMSAPAMAISATNMADACSPSCSIDHHEGDMIAYVTDAAAAGRTYDLVLASFSLHHLSTAAKEQMVAALGRVVAPGGVFLLCDIFKAPGQSREQYLESYRADLEQWEGQDEQGRAYIWGHVSEYDFPEEQGAWEAWGAAHFASSQRLAEKKMYMCMAFSAAAAAEAASS